MQLHFHITGIEEAEAILSLLESRGLLTTPSPTLTTSAPRQMSAGRESEHPLIEHYKRKAGLQRLRIATELERAGYTGPAHLAPLDMRLAIVAGKLAAMGENPDKIAELMAGGQGETSQAETPHSGQAETPQAEMPQVPSVALHEVDDDDI